VHVDLVDALRLPPELLPNFSSRGSCEYSVQNTSHGEVRVNLSAMALCSQVEPMVSPLGNCVHELGGK
jgi:hypothetical protein